MWVLKYSFSMLPVLMLFLDLHTCRWPLRSWKVWIANINAPTNKKNWINPFCSWWNFVSFENAFVVFLNMWKQKKIIWIVLSQVDKLKRFFIQKPDYIKCYYVKEASEAVPAQTLAGTRDTQLMSQRLSLWCCLYHTYIKLRL